MPKNIVGFERRIRGLMDEHERLLGAMVVDESSEGFYIIVIRDWEHPWADDAEILAERYAYLTKGDGNDGWNNDGDSQGGNGINRRDALPAGKLAGALSYLYGEARSIQQGEKSAPALGSIVDGVEV